MHIKSVSKKPAYAFVESLVVFLFVLVIVNLSIKIIYNNYLKSQNYLTYKDLYTLEVDEEIVLEIINTKSEEENLEREKLLKEVSAKKTENYSKYPEIKRIEFIYENGSYYLTKKKENSVMYIELKENKVGNKVYFIPTTYKTKYIYKKE